MKFGSRYNIKIVARALLFAGTTITAVLASMHENMIFTTFSLAVFWIIQLFWFVQQQQKIQRELTDFFKSIQYDDLTVNYSSGKNRGDFPELYAEFAKVFEKIKLARLEKARKELYLQSTLEHAGVGIFAFTGNGKIELCNTTCLKLLNIYNLRNLSELNKLQEGLATIIKNMHPGTQKLIQLKLKVEGGMNDLYEMQITAKAVDFRFQNKQIRLVSLQNIKQEMQQSEAEAWKKLIRVLNHEITNSVSPITLLSAGLIQLLESKEVNNNEIAIDNDDKETIIESLKSIRRRSKGLSKFVESYSQLAKIPKARFEKVILNDLFLHIETLMKQKFEQQKVEFMLEIKQERICTFADEKLLEQVFINLINNALDATANINNPQINITVYTLENKVFIKFTDNGEGIATEIIEQVFTPFFTTKEQGSGIGLSLAKQIIVMHNGDISVSSIKNKETTVSVQLFLSE